MDSIEITIRRTGAATAVAAKYLSRPEAKTMTICGAGNQGRISLETILKVRPTVERVYVYDIDAGQAARFAREFSGQLHIEIEATENLAEALSGSDICVTCTPSRKHFLNGEDIAPGTFIAGVGADSEEKQELDPKLLAANKVVVDILDQCASIGDLHHALDAGLLTRSSVHAELGEVVAGKKAGRSSAAEIIIFDSTGMALQDAATAIMVYEKAVNANRGVKHNFAQ